jgi:hypothetical protein
MKNLTPAETAVRLHTKESTLANWRSHGIGPPYLKLGRILYPEVELERWLESRLRSPERHSDSAGYTRGSAHPRPDRKKRPARPGPAGQSLKHST